MFSGSKYIFLLAEKTLRAPKQAVAQSLLWMCEWSLDMNLCKYSLYYMNSSKKNEPDEWKVTQLDT